jgi:solute carrier family 25 phosphate transporter 3
LSVIHQEEGLNGFYKGLVPLGMRQIPSTIMEFACFEKTMEFLYRRTSQKPRNECTNGPKHVGTFGDGYLTRVLLAVVCLTADTAYLSCTSEQAPLLLRLLRGLALVGSGRVVLSGSL